MGELGFLERKSGRQNMNTIHPLRRKNRKRDKARLAWIHTLPCAICERAGLNQTTISEAAHLGKRGLGQRPPDDTAVPLCWTHHARQSRESVHSLGKAFWEKWGVTAEELIRQYQKMFEERS